MSLNKFLCAICAVVVLLGDAVAIQITCDEFDHIITAAGPSYNLSFNTDDGSHSRLILAGPGVIPLGMGIFSFTPEGTWPSAGPNNDVAFETFSMTSPGICVTMNNPVYSYNSAGISPPIGVAAVAAFRNFSTVVRVTVPRVSKLSNMEVVLSVPVCDDNVISNRVPVNGSDYSVTFETTTLGFSTKTVCASEGLLTDVSVSVSTPKRLNSARTLGAVSSVQTDVSAPCTALVGDNVLNSRLLIQDDNRGFESGEKQENITGVLFDNSTCVVLVAYLETEGSMASITIQYAYANGSCDVDTQCLTDNKCLNHTCIQECMSNSDCASGFDCMDDLCVPVASANGRGSIVVSVVASLFALAFAFNF